MIRRSAADLWWLRRSWTYDGQRRRGPGVTGSASTGSLDPTQRSGPVGAAWRAARHDTACPVTPPSIGRVRPTCGRPA